jgi:segregation and condensation protein A
LDDLIEAARNIFSRPVLLDLSKVVNIPKITIREKITAIISRLRTGQKLTFDDLVNTGNRIDIVVTFLALLELVKRHLVHATQEYNFSAVFLETEEDALFDAEINDDLDYGE